MLAGENQVVSSMEKPTRETVLEMLLKRIQRSEEFPSISKYLIEINQKLAANAETSDASELANIILKDYALTNKLLKLVNSAFYGFAAGKVTTVTRAVVLLGNENVRLATLSLALFEHFKGKTNTVDLKEAIIYAFWSGMLAREIAKMDDKVDPEEAFICAMMGQLGKLLMIYYLPEDYRRIVDRMAERGESEARAVRAVCGVTYNDLGTAVAKQWNFPDQICESIACLTKSDWRDKQNPPGRLRALSSFVKKVGEAIQVEDALTGQEAIQELLDQYQTRIKISTRQLKAVVEGSLEKVQRHALAMDFEVGDSRFLHGLSLLYAQQTQAPRVENETNLPDGASFKLTSDEDLKSGSGALEGQNAKDIIMEGIQEISEAMMAGTNANDVALMSLEIIYRSLKFKRALFFVREGKKRVMSARFGYGDQVNRINGKVAFKVGSDKDLFNVSLQVGKDLIVADAHDKKMSHLVPEWYRKHIDAPAFIFLPVMVQKVCIGAFYADRSQGGQPIDEAEHRHLSMLRNQLVLAIKYRQNSR